MESNGEVAFVAGGANGIGRAIVDAFVEVGTRVVVFDSAVTAGDATNSTLVVAGDVRSQTDVERAMDAALKRWGRIDVLVNDAAIYPAAYLIEEPLAEVTDVLDVNVLGPLRTIRTFVASQLGREAGICRIVNITSTSASHPDARSGAYSVSKAALQCLTQVLALELAPRFTVNAVAPGYIDVRSITNVNRDRVSDDRRKELVQRIPFGRPGQPEHIAAAVLYLCSPAAEHITGATLTVDGGASAGVFHPREARL
jgi:meso-butanediol dehydrogenase/(S,S)-butanediol dehydrogenase/diacetyl reductase